MSKHTNPVQKISIFFKNRKVLKLFRFSYKIAKTANLKTAITSYNTWIWRLKFGLRVQNESYSILFTHIFDFKRKWFHMYRAIIYERILNWSRNPIIITFLNVSRIFCSEFHAMLWIRIPRIFTVSYVNIFAWISIHKFNLVLQIKSSSNTSFLNHFLGYQDANVNTKKKNFRLLYRAASILGQHRSMDNFFVFLINWFLINWCQLI
jgi:hypothetical protein